MEDINKLSVTIEKTEKKLSGKIVFSSFVIFLISCVVSHFMVSSAAQPIAHIPLVGHFFFDFSIFDPNLTNFEQYGINIAAKLANPAEKTINSNQKQPTSGMWAIDCALGFLTCSAFGIFYFSLKPEDRVLITGSSFGPLISVKKTFTDLFSGFISFIVLGLFVAAASLFLGLFNLSFR